ncbi:MAG: hypothetical protein DRO65_01870 [Candidatus Altiarchaeales archaeon]|nr:MAG: hypothetical protein DRO65_01870 [Candidatus Altiarchaeales archaeon]
MKPEDLALFLPLILNAPFLGLIFLELRKAQKLQKEMESRFSTYFTSLENSFCRIEKHIQYLQEIFEEIYRSL